MVLSLFVNEHQALLQHATELPRYAANANDHFLPCHRFQRVTRTRHHQFAQLVVLSTRRYAICLHPENWHDSMRIVMTARYMHLF